MINLPDLILRLCFAALGLCGLGIFLYYSPYHPCLLIGKSMKPSFGIINFALCIKPTYAAVGDVVSYSRPKKKFSKVMHRIIDIDSEGKIYIKGDNAPEIDCVPFSNIELKIKKYWKVI